MILQKRWNVNEVIEQLKQERDEYIKKYHWTADDLWVLLDWDVHMRIIKNVERPADGPDKMSRSIVLGMHALHDKVKNIYIVPKHKPPKEWM